jgi:hypothetical protein
MRRILLFGYDASFADISNFYLFWTEKIFNQRSFILESFYFEIYLFWISGTMFDILPSWFGKSRTNFTMDEFSQLISQASEKEN